MTEKEWENESDLQRMLVFAHDLSTERKLRLFACACCRTVWELFDPQKGQRAIEIVERYVDGNCTTSEFEAVRQESSAILNEATVQEEQAPDDGSPASFQIGLAHRCASLVARAIDPCGFWVNPFVNDGIRRTRVDSVSHWVVDCEYFKNWLRRRKKLTKRARDAIRSHHRGIIRDIFGNPFRPVQFDPRWRTSNVVDLARTIYDERAFERLPILADALLDVGCDSDDILSHCR